MKKQIKICDRCGSNADVDCDLIYPREPIPLIQIWAGDWWPWRAKTIDLCKPCASDLNKWVEDGKKK